MKVEKHFVIALILLALLGIGRAVMGQQVVSVSPDVVVWQQVDIASRDTLTGPAKAGFAPALTKVKFLGKQPGGNNLKYRVEDANGNEWVVKVADESQAEVAASARTFSPI